MVVIQIALERHLYFYNFIGLLEWRLYQTAATHILQSDWLKYSCGSIFSSHSYATSYGTEGQPHLKEWAWLSQSARPPFLQGQS